MNKNKSSIDEGQLRFMLKDVFSGRQCTHNGRQYHTKNTVQNFRAFCVPDESQNNFIDNLVTDKQMCIWWR